MGTMYEGISKWMTNKDNYRQKVKDANDAKRAAKQKLDNLKKAQKAGDTAATPEAIQAAQKAYNDASNAAFEADEVQQGFWNDLMSDIGTASNAIRSTAANTGANLGNLYNNQRYDTEDPRSKGNRAVADVADMGAADQQKLAQKSLQEGNRDERNVAAADTAANQANKATKAASQLSASAGGAAADLAGAQAVMGENMDIAGVRNYQAQQRQTGAQQMQNVREAQSSAASLRGQADANDAYAKNIAIENMERSRLAGDDYSDGQTDGNSVTVNNTPASPSQPDPNARGNGTQTPEGNGTGTQTSNLEGLSDETKTAVQNIQSNGGDEYDAAVALNDDTVLSNLDNYFDQEQKAAVLEKYNSVAKAADPVAVISSPEDIGSKKSKIKQVLKGWWDKIVKVNTRNATGGNVQGNMIK